MKELNIKDFIESIETRREFNDIPFNEFMGMLESHFGIKIDEQDKVDWEFTGLMNHNFLDFCIQQYT